MPVASPVPIRLLIAASAVVPLLAAGCVSRNESYVIRGEVIAPVLAGPQAEPAPSDGPSLRTDDVDRSHWPAREVSPLVDVVETAPIYFPNFVLADRRTARGLGLYPTPETVLETGRTEAVRRDEAIEALAAPAVQTFNTIAWPVRGTVIDPWTETRHGPRRDVALLPSEPTPEGGRRPIAVRIDEDGRPRVEHLATTALPPAPPKRVPPQPDPAEDPRAEPPASAPPVEPVAPVAPIEPALDVSPGPDPAADPPRPEPAEDDDGVLIITD